MNTCQKILSAAALLFTVCFCSCTQHLENININPNGADPATTNPNLVLSTVLKKAGKIYVKLGFGNPMGVMQYTQKDGFGSEYNNYEWDGSNPWADYYNVLRNDQYVYKKAVASNNELLEGVSLVMRSMMFGLLTDLYGPIPYKDALQGAKGGHSNTFPAFSPQKTVYLGILADLKKANKLLSKPKSEYTGNITNVDLYYHGDPAKWRKLANSLALRYYMRLSNKLPKVAKKGIERIVGNPSKYPIITTAADDAVMAMSGTSDGTSWPTNVKYNADSTNYRRVKMCKTFVNKLESLNDPRLAVWAQKVQVFLQVNKNLPPGAKLLADTTINGEKRKVLYISPEILTARHLTVNDIDQDPNYVGIPVALGAPQGYNLSPDPVQSSHNTHVSWLDPIYTKAKGPLLKARIMSAADVHFIIAEAKAVYGWTNANAAQQYYAGIKASFAAWGVRGKYSQYIQQPKVAFNGTQKQIIVQKWIANWSAAQEAWFDYRRTGYPDIHAANRTVAPRLPLRFYYPKVAQNLNTKNEQAAAQKLKVTQYSAFGAAGKYNSAWSKMWLLQGTGEPWQ